MFVRRHLLTLILISGSVFISACRQEPAQQASKPSATPPDTVAVSPSDQLQKIRTEIREVKIALAKDGKYKCCVNPSCDWCLLNEGECLCLTNLKAGKAVCPGCGLGWHNGQGIVQGIQANQVKWAITHEHSH